MARTNVNPTRMELTRLKRQLSIATRGHKLLKDKQDEMVRQFMLLIKKNKSLRAEVDEEMLKINHQFRFARLKMSSEGVNEALLVPTKDVKVEVGVKTIMNIKVPSISYHEGESLDLTYGFAFTPSELDDSILMLSHLLPKLIALAELDKSCDMLANEIEKTRRRVNAIEFVMIPEMKENIRMITMKLEDNERSNIIRLMKSKEIILAKTTPTE